MIKLLICFCLMSSTIFSDVLYWQIDTSNSYQFANIVDFKNKNVFKFDSNWLIQFTSAFNDCQKYIFFEWLISDENLDWRLIDYISGNEIDLNWISLEKIFQR